jgi:peroxiredoxin
MLEAGAPAPDFTLPDQAGKDLSLAGLKGETVVLYFYPRADTPGCTTQAFAKVSPKTHDDVVLGALAELR